VATPHEGTEEPLVAFADVVDNVALYAKSTLFCGSCSKIGASAIHKSYCNVCATSSHCYRLCPSKGCVKCGVVGHSASVCTQYSRFITASNSIPWQYTPTCGVPAMHPGFVSEMLKTARTAGLEIFSGDRQPDRPFTSCSVKWSQRALTYAKSVVAKVYPAASVPEQEVIVREALNENKVLRGLLPLESAVDLMRTTGYVVDGSGEVVCTGTQLFEKAAELAVRGACAPELTYLINPSAALMHLFSMGYFHFDSHKTSGEVRGDCDCGSLKCQVLQQAIIDGRVTYGTPTDAILAYSRFLVVSQENLSNVSWGQLLSRHPHLVGYSTFFYTPEAILKPQHHKHSGTQHYTDETDYLCTFKDGHTVSYAIDKAKSFSRPIVGSVAVSRATILAWEGLFLTRIVVADGLVSHSWQAPSQQNSYWLPNFLLEVGYISVDRVGLDTIIRRLALKGSSYQDVMMAINTSSLTVTLSGVELASRLSGDTDVIAGLAVFLMVYLPMLKNVTQQEVVDKAADPYGATAKALLRRLGASCAIMSNSVVLKRLVQFFKSDYTSLAQVNDTVRKAVLGAQRQSIGWWGRFMKWYVNYGFENAHKQLYGKKFSLTSLIKGLLNVADITVDGLLTLMLKLSSCVQQAVEMFALALLYLLDSDEYVSAEYFQPGFEKICSFLSGYSHLRDIALRAMVLAALVVKTRDFSGPVKTILAAVGKRWDKGRVHSMQMLLRDVVPMHHHYDVVEFMNHAGLPEIEDYKEYLKVVNAAPVVVQEVKPAVGGGTTTFDVLVHPRVVRPPISSTGGWDLSGLDDLTELAVPEFYLSNTLLAHSRAMIPVNTMRPEMVDVITKAVTDNREYAPATKKLAFADEVQHFLREVANSGIPAVASVANVARDLWHRNKEIWHIDLILAGPPMSGKSQCVRESITEMDCVVCPTNALADAWRSELAALGKNNVDVYTQHSIFHCGKRYRWVVVDEAWTLSAVHVAFIFQMGSSSIALGDPAQVPAVFAASKLQQAFSPDVFAYAHYLYAPLSFMPLDALRLCCHIGLDTGSYKGEIFALTKVEQSLSFGFATDIDAEMNVITFTQAGKGRLYSRTSTAISAHESQGSRFNESHILWDDVESTYGMKMPRHLIVALSRARVATVLHVDSTASIKVLPGVTLGVNGEKIDGIDALQLPSALALRISEEIIVEEHAEVIKDVMDYVPPPRDLRRVVVICMAPNGGKTTFVRELANSFPSVDVDDLISEFKDLPPTQVRYDAESAAVSRKLRGLTRGVVFLHHPAQWKDMPVKPLVLLHPFVPLLDKNREIAYHRCSASLALYPHFFCSTRAELKGSVWRHLHANGVLEVMDNDIPRAVAVELFAECDSVQVTQLDLTPSSLASGTTAAVHKVNLGALDLKRHDTFVSYAPNSIFSVPAVVARGKAPSIDRSRLMAHHIPRLESLFNDVDILPNSDIFKKSSAQFTDILRAVSREPEAWEADSYAFPKGQVPKKTNNLLKNQGVVAQHPYMQAIFASMVAKMSLYLLLNLRSNIIVDLGYSEEALTARLQSLWAGMTKPMYEFDLEKQDTSHMRIHIEAFSWLAKRAGVGALWIRLFEDCRCKTTKIYSMDMLCVLLTKYALGSGAPWTLLANCWMTLTTLAVDTDFGLDDSLVQKGDDGGCTRMLNFNQNLMCNDVIFKHRVGAMSSFCSKVYHKIVFRKLGKRYADLQRLTAEDRNFKDKWISFVTLYDEISEVGDECYGQALELGLDMPDGAGQVLAREYLALFESRLPLLAQRCEHETRLLCRPVVISEPRYCFWEAVAAYSGPLVADKYLHLRRDGVTLSEVEMTLRAEKIPNIKWAQDISSRSAKAYALSNPAFHGVIYSNDHAVAVLNRKVYEPP